MACRRRRGKQELLRIARSPDGTAVADPGGQAPGRGAYVCRDDPSCARIATRRDLLARALGVTLARDDLARLATDIERETGLT